MNILQRIARLVIKRSFHLSVWVIERLYDTRPYQEKVVELGNLPEGTLGRDIYNCLKDTNLSLVPKYESHDLKHVLLDFKMTPEDEISMQAFMLGNGNISLPCVTILLYGAIFLPEKWGMLYFDFQRGRKSKPISNWNVADYANENTIELRQSIFNNPIPKKQNTMLLKKLSTSTL